MAWPLLVALACVLGCHYVSGVNPLVNEDCKGHSDENFLEPHMIYEYSYHGLATTLSLGTTDLQDKIDIKCNVQIQHNSHCLFQMDLDKCRLTASQDNGPEILKKWMDDVPLDPVNSYPIAFNLDNGEIKHIFHHSDDPIFSVNIKRGILSAFVLKKKELKSLSTEKTQVDIHGSCPAKVTAVKEGEALLEKDMLHCAVPSRNNWNLSPYSLFWNMSFIQYLINSSAECHYISDGASLQKVKCHERHAIMLESTQHTTTAVQTLISYTMEQKDARKSDEWTGPSLELETMVVSGIAFEYDKSKVPSRAPVEFESKALKILGDLVSTSQDELKLFTVELFNRLVAWLRQSPVLTDLSMEVIQCKYIDGDCSDWQTDLGMSYYQDALVQCNTGACLSGFAYLVKEKKVPKSYLDLALLSITNARNLEPESITAILNICKSTNYRFCWLSIGALIHTFSEEHDNIDQLSHEVLEHVRFLANYPKDTHCGVGDKMPMEVQLSAFKTIGNLGKVAQIYNPDIADHLANCGIYHDVSTLNRVAALQALRKMILQPSSYSKLLEILKNENFVVSIRIAAYNELIFHFHNIGLVEALISILKSTEINHNIKSFVASDLNDILKRPQFHHNGELIAKHLNHILDKDEFDLESVTIDPYKTSYTFLNGGFSEFDFLPKEIKGFGALLREEILYGSLSGLPETWRMNLTMELFSKVYNLLEAGLQTGGWETVALRTIKMGSKLNNVNPYQLFMVFLQQLTGRDTAWRSQEQMKEPYVLNKKIEDSIASLREMFQNKHQDIKPYLLAYVRLFGNELDLTSLDDILKVVIKSYQGVASVQPTSFNKKDLSINSTHVLNFIEAYHQFPTMMGLPLNWTTDATLAFSVKAGINTNLKSGQGGKFAIHMYPSAACTFINKMVLDVPTYTSIGAQSNTSAYTSTKWDWEIMFMQSGTFKISLKAPKEVQRPLELFRKNYYLQGDEVQELQDWDIHRKESVECFNENFEKATGLHVCIDQSYADVTNRVKPWFLLAGSAHWRMTAVKADAQLQSYDLDAQFSRQGDILGLFITCNAAGTIWTRRVPFKLVIVPDKGEYDLEITHQDYPEFKFVSSEKKIIHQDKPVGFEFNVELKNEGMEYAIDFSSQDRKEERKEDSMGRNKTPKSDKIVVVVSDEMLKIKSLHNTYLVTSKVHNTAANIKVDFAFKYSNSDSDSNWLSKILPPSFWVDKNSASFELRGNWRAPVFKGKHHKQVSTSTHVTIPYSTTEILTQRVVRPKHSHFHLNITKKEQKSGKTITFLNLSNYWQKNGNLDIHHLNLTVPRHSWAGDMSVDTSHQALLVNMELIGAKMIHKEEGDSSYVGWWHPSHSDRFEHKEWKFGYNMRVKFREGNDSELSDFAKKRLNINEESESGSKGVVDTAIKITYPFIGHQEYISYSGIYKMFSGRTPRYTSYSESSILNSSLHNLEVTSNSDYMKIPPMMDRQFQHNSHLRHSKTKADYGSYELKMIQTSEEGCNYLFDISDEFAANWLSYKSQTYFKCKPGNPYPAIANLDIVAVHPYWNELDYTIKQIFDFSYPGGESMNYTSPIMDINVKGEWWQNHYGKTAVFTSKTDLLSSATFDFNSTGNALDTSVTFPDKEIRQINLRRRLNDKRTKYDLNIGHKVKGSEEEIRDFALLLHLTSPHTILVKGEVNEEFGKHLKLSLKAKYRELMARIWNRFHDPESQLNQNMQPILGMTVGDYLKNINRQAHKLCDGMLMELKDTAEAFSGLYGTSLQVAINIQNAINEAATEVDEDFKKTLPGWAYHYFDVSSALKSGVNSYPEVVARTYWTKTNQDSNVQFYEEIDHPFTWNKLNQLPRLSLDHLPDNFYEVLYKGKKDYLKPPRRNSMQKQAMIFGNKGILTFDGKLYQSVSFPKSDCAYLLAHDTRAGTLSIAATESSVHILFLNSAVTIDKKGSVHINATKEDTELPISLPNRLTVSREGSVVSVSAKSLFRVQCDVVDTFCIFTLDSLYHSGTIGLLGNANDNPSDDFQDPDGELIESISRLFSVYELTQQPFCKKTIEPATPQPTFQSLYHCESFLESSVSLRECSKKAGFDSKAFINSCAHEEDQGESNCHTSNALYAFCSSQGLKLNGRCDSCRARVSAPPKWKIHSTHKLEVILVVDQHKSVLKNDRRGFFFKGIESLVNLIDENFRSNGYSSVTFSLVGFGGQLLNWEPTSPQLHILNKDPWVSVKEVPSLLQTLKFHEGQRANPLEAVEFAVTAVPYENSASKLALLFTVDDEKFSSTSHQLLNSQKLLEDSGLTLYTFASFPSIDKGKKVFGLRADGYIFPQAGSDDYMDCPRTPLAKLTSGTQGSIFLKKFLDESSNYQFTYSVSEEIAAKVMKETQKCKSCHCTRNHLWTRNEYCKPEYCR